MASLTEELITILEEENKLIFDLIPITEKKTGVIIKNDLKTLQTITEQEQLMVETIHSLERKREEIVINMGTVLSRDPKTLRLKNMIKLLEKRPEEQKKLSSLYDTLTEATKKLSTLNERNRQLISQSLEMIEFEMNLVQSTRMAPGGNHYNKKASAFDMPISTSGMFDAKQ